MKFDTKLYIWRLFLIIFLTVAGIFVFIFRDTISNPTQRWMIKGFLIIGVPGILVMLYTYITFFFRGIRQSIYFDDHNVTINNNTIPIKEISTVQFKSKSFSIIGIPCPAILVKDIEGKEYEFTNYLCIKEEQFHECYKALKKS
nr:DUF5381 family protein [Scopulibacillus daqui]